MVGTNKIVPDLWVLRFLVIIYLSFQFHSTLLQFQLWFLATKERKPKFS